MAATRKGGEKVGAKTSIPPPSTGYWAWVRDELKTKADENWVSSELRGLKRMFDDTKVTATDARKAAEKPYECAQRGEIEKLKEWQYQVMNWKIPVIISIIVLVIGAAGQYFSLKDAVEDGNEDRVEVQETLRTIQVQQEQTAQIVEEMQSREEYKAEERKEELKEILKQVVEEVKNDTDERQPRRNRRER